MILGDNSSLMEPALFLKSRAWVSTVKRSVLIIYFGAMMGSLFGAPVPTQPPSVPSPQAPVPTPQPPLRPPALLQQAPLPVVTPATKPSVAPAAPQETFSFGAKLVGGQVEHTFLVANPGKAVLQVKSISSSCSCTQVVRFTSKVQPGGVGSILIHTKLDQVGSKNVTLTAVFGDGRVQTYQVLGDIVAPLVTEAAPVDVSDFVNPKDLLDESRTGQPLQANTILDLRPAPDFAEAHIPSAINVPIFGLSMRSNFAHDTLVLVGSGVDDLALDMQVKACRKMGFQSVHYLKGGMRLWQQNGGALTGIVWKTPHLNVVPSSQLVQSARHSPWTLFLPKKLSSTLSGPPPALCNVVTYNSKADLQTKVKAVADGNIGLFVPQPDLPKLTASLVGSPTCPLFFVTDSWQQYVQLATTESLAQASHLVTASSGPMGRRIKNCPTCP